MKKWTKIIVLILCAALITGTALAAGGNPDNRGTNTAISEALSDTSDNNKETVYVLSGADGGANKVIVAETETGELNYSDDAEDLPLTMNITYTLDGAEVSAEALAGKSGRVTIRFDYENHAEIGGTSVPFAVITGALLDHEVFSNIEVTNGRLMDDGDRTAVIGFALPGLNDSLEFDDIDLPEHFEISADAESFALGSTYTVISNSLFNDISTDKLSDVDDLTGDLDELTDAMTQLIDGSDKLHDGLGDLYDGAKDYTDGVQKLSGGLDTLNDNSAALNNGAKQVFDSLLSMANTQIAAAGLDVPKLTISNYSSVISSAIASLDPSAAQAMAEAKVSEAVHANERAVREAVTAAVREQVELQVTAAVKAEVEAQVIAAVRENVTAQVLLAMELTPETYETGIAAGAISEEQQGQINAAIDAQMASDAVKSLIASNLDAQMASDNVKALIASNTEAQMQSETVLATIEAKTTEQIESLIAQNLASDEVQEQIADGAKQMESGRASLEALKAQLDSYNEFYTGIKTYTDGVKTAADGAKALTAASPELLDGAAQLRDGSKELADGIKKLNDEGISKLTDLVNDDLAGLKDKLEKISDASKAYTAYGDANADSVRFIYKTDEIRK